MNILIFSGTTEGRKISEYLSSREIAHTVSVATESGKLVMEDNPYGKILVGRMDQSQMEEFIGGTKEPLVIDATHPYAKEATENIRNACEKTGARYIRLLRKECERNLTDEDFLVHEYDNVKQCAFALNEEAGNVLLTTGSKELGSFMEGIKDKSRFFVRVLPSIDALNLCKEAGIEEKNIIAMYGPHSAEMNRAIIKQYGIKHLVTKESGQAGGYDEKIDAAMDEDCQIHIIGRPIKEEGISLEECYQLLNNALGLEELDKKLARPELEVTLVGVGMGNEGNLTFEAKKAIAEADFILGASRMIEPYADTHKTKAIYIADAIIPFLEELLSRGSEKIYRVAVLFSGDTGIYSGATKLQQALKEWGKCSQIRRLAGISSFSAFAAELGVEYTKTHLESLHGKSNDEKYIQYLKELLAQGCEVMLLMSGNKDFNLLEGLLLECGAERRIVDIGYNISYVDQKIIRTDVKDMVSAVESLPKGLFIVRVGGNYA